MEKDSEQSVHVALRAAEEWLQDRKEMRNGQECKIGSEGQDQPPCHPDLITGELMLILYMSK